MEAKLKAKKLLDKFYFGDIKEYEAKMCAIIAVIEIINANPHSNPLNTDVYSTMDYWQQVKSEIEKL